MLHISKFVQLTILTTNYSKYVREYLSKKISNDIHRIFIFIILTSSIFFLNQNQKKHCSPPVCRYSGPLVEGLTDSTNQSITGSYVDFSRDYYTPSIQNANNFLIQSTLQRGETPTYV